MTIDKQALRNSALEMISVLGYIASFESEDIDGDDLELRFETEGGFDTGCTISITSQCQDAADVMQQLLNELEAMTATAQSSLGRVVELENTIEDMQRKERHSERQAVIDQLCAAGEPWEEIQEYMQKWDAEYQHEATAGIKGSE